MATDARPPQENETPAAGNDSTDRPAYREAATPEEVEDDAQEHEDMGTDN